MEKIKKDIQNTFKDCGLNIAIQSNLKVVDYLDCTFNLDNCTHQPYRKANDETSYINVNSNHPPNIIKQIPKSLEKRISQLSYNQEIFKQAVPHYEQALRNSGYNTKLNYTENTATNPISRKRKIIWFNPPYSRNVQTKVAKQFLNLIDKHFPRDHKFYKLFNRNNVKVSYSCVPNMKSYINSHNIQVTQKPTEKMSKWCNCINKDQCPKSKVPYTMHRLQSQHHNQSR